MKRILAIQDFCVIGKNSGHVSISIFSAMGIEVVFVPVSLCFSKCFSLEQEENCITDLSDNLSKYSKGFIENKIHFDCVFVKGEFSEIQAGKINDFVNCCISDDCLLILSSNESLHLFKNLYKKAAVVITNLSQFFSLSDVECDENIKNKDFVQCLINKNKKLVYGSLIITDFFINSKKRGIILCEKHKDDLKWFYHNVCNSGFYGLDDIFNAVMVGYIIKGLPIEKAIKLSIDFTEKSEKETLSKPAHNWYGADFESIILQLSGSLP